MTTPRSLVLTLALCTALSAAVATAMLSPAQTPTPPTPATQPAKAGFLLIFDYSDGVQKHFTALPHTPGMTVLDALAAAKAHPRGITFEHRGSGPTTFLTQIDDLKNEGGGGTSRNWQFFVNGGRAKESCGVARINPGDEVLWAFRPLEKSPASKAPDAPKPQPANNPADH